MPFADTDELTEWITARLPDAHLGRAGDEIVIYTGLRRADAPTRPTQQPRRTK